MNWKEHKDECIDIGLRIIAAIGLFTDFFQSATSRASHRRNQFVDDKTEGPGGVGLVDGMGAKWFQELRVSMAGVVSARRIPVSVAVFSGQGQRDVFVRSVGDILTAIVKYCRVDLHREAGYKRFFQAIFGFAFGLDLIVLSGSIEMLFAGWEIVGISSFLVVILDSENLTMKTNAWGGVHLQDTAPPANICVCDHAPAGV